MEEIPILEFDPERRAVINPDIVIDRVPDADGCVLSFFSNIVETMASEQNLSKVAGLRS